MQERFQDCGLMIYRKDQPVQAGASGAGCSATVPMVIYSIK